MDKMEEAEKGKYICSEETHYKRVNSTHWATPQGMSVKYDLLVIHLGKL